MDDHETLIPGHGVFEVYSSANGNTGFENWNAFDKVSNPGWSVAGNFTSGNYTGSSYLGDYKGEYLVLKLPYAIKLKSIGVIPRSAVTDRYPSDYTIVGSNDGNVWSSLKSFSGLTYTDTHQTINSDITYSYFGMVVTKLNQTSTGDRIILGEWQLFGTPGPTTLDKGSLSLTRSLDVPRISRYDVDTETPRPEKLVVDFDTNIPPFNNQFIEDKSGRGNDGTFYNGASYSPADKAFVFNGTDDYIKLDPGLTGNVVHSISMWVKAVADLDTGSIDVVLYWGAGGSGSHRVEIYMADDIISYNFASNDYNVTFPANTLVNDRWYHLVFTYNGVGGASGREIYIDGVQQIGSHTGSTAVLTLANSDLYLASNFSPGGQYHFGGQISNFKLYDVALEPSEVQKLYRLGRTGRSMILADTSLQIGAGLHDSINTTGGPRATLDVHGSILASSTIHGMSGNFHKMLGYARGGGQADHHRADNCLVAMGGMTVAGGGNYASAAFIIRKSGSWMPFIVECYHAGNNSNSASMFGRQAVLFGAINGTSITPSNGSAYSGSSTSGITLSAAARGDGHVLFNVSVNREGRSYGVMMCRLTYYYGIKGRVY
jgi:hypothetical protein